MVGLPLVRGASAEESAKASIALLRLSWSGPIFIAKEKGWFKEAGLDLSLKDFQSAAQVPLAVAAGDAHLRATAFTPAFLNPGATGGMKGVAPQRADRPGWELNVIRGPTPGWGPRART